MVLDFRPFLEEFLTLRTSPYIEESSRPINWFIVSPSFVFFFFEWHFSAPEEEDDGWSLLGVAGTILFVVPEEPVDTLDMTLQLVDPDFEDIATY